MVRRLRAFIGFRLCGWVEVETTMKLFEQHGEGLTAPIGCHTLPRQRLQRIASHTRILHDLLRARLPRVLEDEEGE